MKIYSLLLILLMLGFFNVGNSFGDYSSVTVDVSSTLGYFPDALFGTTGSPPFSSIDLIGYQLVSSANFGILGVMISGFGPSNPYIPFNYNFTSLDTQVTLIFSHGAVPIIQFFISSPPSSLSNYTTYIANVARHLTQGWNNGFNYPVKYYRFGNEPDFPVYWSGTNQEFFRTYGAVAKALKSVDSSFIISSPALSDLGTVYDNGSTKNFVIDFLNYCRDSEVPLDIFTFHAYGPVLYNKFNRDWKIINSTLSNYSGISPLYGKPKLGCDEWNLLLGDVFNNNVYQPEFDTIWAGAHNITAWIELIENGIEHSIRYGGPFNGQDTSHDFPMVHYPSNQPKPVYYAFQAANQFRRSNRIFSQGSDGRNFSVLAGSFNNDTLQILISHFDTHSYLTSYHPNTTSSVWDDYRLILQQQGLLKYPTYTGATILIQNLPWGDTTNQILCDRYLVDDTTNFVKVTTTTYPASSTLLTNIPLDKASVQLLVFYSGQNPVPVELSYFEALEGIKD
jgi:hypothetical protein